MTRMNAAVGIERNKETAIVCEKLEVLRETEQKMISPLPGSVKSVFVRCQDK